MSLMRVCVVCGQVDNHPRDVVSLPGDQVAYHHHDCGARLEPACPSCLWLVQHKGDLTGDDWRQHIGSLHAAMDDGQQELHPKDRDAVVSHIDGKVAK